MSRLWHSHDMTRIGRAHSLPTVGAMVETESRSVRLRALVTKLIARCLLPLAALRAPGRARWLERHGHRYHLYRRYDNEWWHFEYRPEYAGQPPPRRPHPDAVAQP